MSNSELLQAIHLIGLYPDEADFVGPREAWLIAQAESRLGLEFPHSYREFLSVLGCGDFAGDEFYGLIDANFDESGIPDAVWITLKERADSGIPDHLLIVSDDPLGGYFALDCSQMDAVGECPVVAIPAAYVPSQEALSKIADDFGGFILQSVKRAVSND